MQYINLSSVEEKQLLTTHIYIYSQMATSSGRSSR